jgi:hypothetical protein
VEQQKCISLGQLQDTSPQMLTSRHQQTTALLNQEALKSGSCLPLKYAMTALFHIITCSLFIIISPYHLSISFNVVLPLQIKQCHKTKSSVVWDIILCSLLKVNQRFGGTCHLHLQGRRGSQVRNEHEAVSKWLEGAQADTSNPKYEKQ